MHKVDAKMNADDPRTQTARTASASAERGSSPALTGLELSRLFFEEAVEPIIDEVMPQLRYTAGLIGDCSDVIGFDDEISRDHGWGPRCQLLLPPEGFESLRATLDDAMAWRLPLRYRGYPTSFTGRPGFQMVELAVPPVRHWVDMATPDRFLRDNIGVPSASGLTARDWITMRDYRVLNITAGELFRDDLGFEQTRRALAHYPDDVRLYFLLAEWMIADPEARSLADALQRA
jgi:hypothetical protein